MLGLWHQGVSPKKLSGWCYIYQGAQEWARNVLEMESSTLDMLPLRHCTQKIKPVNSKGKEPRIVWIGRTDAEAEPPILWPPDVKSWITGKDLDAGTDWRQEEKGETEDEIIGWHHWLNGHDFEQTLGDSEGQGSLACCSSWNHKESDTT